ncbi:related to gEgh 16 protein [Rhynchosporium agropyri]|uniref:Related to gEgh 16 protein n=1 Tax=Rhynchosporium agropyri TaxID=914238 RepID=A0A1E1KBK7_9HELO|nr:related to gEgh 16 protein [Rhynchosporium agropyri]
MISSIFYATGLLSLANAHGVILGAQGEAGSPASVGFQVNDAIARNCTSISPCQQDTTIIRDAEIKANVVNECGRTELTGNIDIGENTENALAANQVTSVKAGTQMTVTIHQVNADGAGPYVCDLEETGNTGVFTQNLTVTDNVPGANGFSQAKTQDFNITVTMPDNMNCIGGSNGKICTVRCRNNAQAGPFGGCFAVQQTDGKANANTPENIATAATLPAVLDQVKQDQQDLDAAVKANQVSGQGAAAFKASGAEPAIVSKPVEPQTLSRENINGPAATGAAGSATTSSTAAKATKATGGNGNGNANAGNGNRQGNGRGNANGNGNGNGRNNNNNNNNNKRA